MPAIITLVLDIAKGYFALWLAARLTNGNPAVMSLAALAVMAGHAFPVFLKFKGGKAVASYVGAFLYLTPIPLLAVLIVFVIVVAATRHISAGSMVAAGTLPLGVWMIDHPPAIVVIAALIAGAFIIWRHKANIDRIRAGNESVFRWTRPPERQVLQRHR
jgi:glycerol-3-phosphate acyltransferase PlsY